MKKLVLFPSYVVLYMALSFCMVAGSTGTAIAEYQEQSGLLVIEAENYHSKSNTSVRDWYIFPRSSSPTPDPDPAHTSGASGGEYVEILPDERVYATDSLNYNDNLFLSGSNAPRMNYKVHINTAGRYYIRARAYYTGTEDNSVHFGYDNTWPTSGTAAQWCNARNQWQWSGKRRTSTVHCGVYNALYLDLTAGDHTIMVAMREDGVEIDKFILTTSSSYFPSGTGPSENSESSGTSNTAPTVDAGSNQTISLDESATLSGSASDDGIPNSTLSIEWEQFSGPGNADIASDSQLNTTVSFDRTGFYVLQLSANDGDLESTDKIGITVTDAEDEEDTTTEVSASDEDIVIEAEDYNSKVSKNGKSWNAVTKSGTESMQVTPDSGTRIASNYVSNSPYMRFNVNFSATGTYYLWLRGYAVSNGNSAHVGLDGETVSTAENMALSVKNSFAWTGTASGGKRARLSITSTGSHTIEVYMREDGFTLDKLLLTTASDYTPTGDVTGESSSSDSSSSDGDSQDSVTSEDSFQQESTNGLVTLQVEDRNATVDKGDHGWVSITQAGVQGMEVVPDSGTRINTNYTTQSPYLQFNVNFVKTGTHYIWVRGYCMGNDNSIHVGLNGTAPSSAKNITLPVKKALAWSGSLGNGQRASFTVTKTGEQTVEIYMREDGIMLDKAVLTTSLSYEP